MVLRIFSSAPRQHNGSFSKQNDIIKVLRGKKFQLMAATHDLEDSKKDA